MAFLSGSSGDRGSTVRMDTDERLGSKRSYVSRNRVLSITHLAAIHDWKKKKEAQSSVSVSRGGCASCVRGAVEWFRDGMEEGRGA